MLEDEIDANTVIIHSGVRLLDAARTLCFQTVTLWRVEIEFAAMFAVAEITILRRHGLGSEPIDIGAESRLCFNSNLSIEGEIQQINRDRSSLFKTEHYYSNRNSSYIFCNSSTNVHRLSLECRVNIFVMKNIYIPEYVNCCNRHLDTNGHIL